MNKTTIVVTLVIVVGALIALAMFLFKGKSSQQELSPSQIASFPTAEAQGTLSFKTGQFVIKVNETRQVYLLNSGNPKVVLALKPLLNSQITITGKPNGPDPKRSGDWYLLSVNGKQILQDSELQKEFNFSIFYGTLSANKKDCVNHALSDATVQTLINNPDSILDLSNDGLQKVAACVE